MSKSINVIARVKAEILKSGFPLEIFTRETLLHSGWMVSSGRQFLTPQNEQRDIDIEASFQFDKTKNEERVKLFSILLVECKKNSNSPWVFFSDIFPPIGQNLVFENNQAVKKQSLLIYDSRIKHHHLHAKYVSSSYTLAFKSEDSKEGRQIYEEVTKLINCFKFHCHPLKTKSSSKHHFATYFHLIVVFDGILLFATPKDNDLHIRKVKHVIVNHTESILSKYNHYSVDIVHRDYFKRFLAMCKKDHLSLSNRLNKKMSANQQLKLTK